MFSPLNQGSKKQKTRQEARDRRFHRDLRVEGPLWGGTGLGVQVGEGLGGVSDGGVSESEVLKAENS